MRNAFLISETSFKRDTALIKELSNYVVESLGCAYPELEKNIKQVQQIIDYEEEVFKTNRKESSVEWQKLIQSEPNLSKLNTLETPGLIKAYKDLKSNRTKRITPEIAFKLYDTFGLDEDAICDLATALNLPFNSEDLFHQLEQAKIRSKQLNCASDISIKQVKTDDSFKYKYGKEGGRYVFGEVPVEVLEIIEEKSTSNTTVPISSKKTNEKSAELGENIKFGLIFDKTNMYHEAGGQLSDVGTVCFDSGEFDIFEVVNVDGAIVHKGLFHANSKESKLTTGLTGKMRFDELTRIQLMQNHTAVHLLNSALKKQKRVTCQKSSKVTPNYFNLDVGIFGDKLSTQEIEKIEQEVNKVIKSNVDVCIETIDSQRLLDVDGVTLIPGEVYPDNEIRLVQVDCDGFVSREPCCGTHVLCTGDVRDFCVVSCKSLGRSATSIHGVTGNRAVLARRNGQQLLQDVEKLKRTADNNIDKVNC